MARKSRQLLRLEGDAYCFGCGPRNPRGLRLRFAVDRQRRALTTTYRSLRAHQGYRGLLHGGILTTILDEAMGRLAYELERPAATARLEVRFRLPVRVGERLRIEASIQAVKRKALKARARALTADGEVAAEAEALLIRSSESA
ncbi:MAG: PaaI family thioesterase [Nitrospirae bacterium]|nr:PaaI family thioesterase [Nitrospirota bacterium]